MARNGKSLVWPAEALEIIAKKADPVELCAELARVSHHDRRACWRFLKKHGVDRQAFRPRIHYSWPPEAESIAQRKCNPAALCAELTSLTGYNERACWNFLERHGVRRPGSTSRTNLIPYITVPLADTPIQEIMVGPGPNSELDGQALKTLTDATHHAFRLTTSRIPFRNC
jgi:hypothetical protein